MRECVELQESMPNEEIVKYSVLLPKSAHKLLKQASLDHDLSMQKIVRRAVDVVVQEIRSGKTAGEEQQGASVYPAEFKPVHDLLQFVLDRGTAKDVDWITGNLQNFAEAIRSRERLPAKRKSGT